MGSNISILNTGAYDVELQRIAVAAGVTLDTLPFIQVTDVADRSDVQDELQQLYGRAVAVAFTSAQAVHAICAQAGFKAGEWRVYCLGHATKEAVLEYFDGSMVNGAGRDAAALADEIVAAGVKDVVFFCGNQRLDTLPEALQKKGVSVKEIVVYETEETPVFVAGDHDGILFFSPSAVSSYFGMNVPDEHVVLFAIGQTTAAAIKANSNNQVVISETPQKEAVLQTAIAYLKEYKLSKRA